jgi:transposase
MARPFWQAEALSPELQSALKPLLAEIESVSERIAEYNDRIAALAESNYPQVKLLKQIKGVGTLIALTFLLTLEDPHRFRKSRPWAAIWDCSRDAETRARASRRCISVRKAIPICARCWCKEHNISWDRSVWTAILGAGD